MNQAVPTCGELATRRPTFFWITIGLLGVLLLVGGVIAGLLASGRESIDRSGGWGWILAGGIFAAAATFVCAACAVCAAVSLLRREKHRRLSIAFLIMSCLVVWTFKGVTIRLVEGFLNEGATKVTESAQSSVAGADLGATIPASLAEHFRRWGLNLRPEVRKNARGTEWILENADVSPRCEVVTIFMRFQRSATVAAMRNHLQLIGTPSVLNEREGLAMFYPYARAKTSDKSDCDEWSTKATNITGQFLAAFRSYEPTAATDRAGTEGP